MTGRDACPTIAKRRVLGGGLEPPFTDPKSGVLPVGRSQNSTTKLHSPALFAQADRIVAAHPLCARTRVRALGKHRQSQYGTSRAAYDLRKLRAKQIIRRIGRTRRYEPIPTGLRALTALVVLRNKAIKPLLAAAEPLRPPRGAQNPRAIDRHYEAIRLAMQGVFDELGLAA